MKKVYAMLYNNPLTPDPNDYYGKIKPTGVINNTALATVMEEEGIEIKRETLLDILGRADRIKVEKLAEGYVINDGVCYARIGINGNFIGETDQFDKNEHKLIATFAPGQKLREALKNTKVDILGAAKVQPIIGKIMDNLTGTDNEIITANNVITIEGEKIKILGDQEDNGVYFINQSDQMRTKCAQIIQNDPKKLILMVPDLPSGDYILEVVTQFANGNTTLKEPRSTKFEHILIVE